jgi:ribosomal protein S18 acetylase RimI-like enzyme
VKIEALSEITTRSAEPRDARALSRFYVEEYTPSDGGSARDHYPFVQLLEPLSLRRELARRDLCWVVAEMNGRVVGVVGATRSAPCARDRVSEFFGLVVDGSVRRAGVATAMIRYACGMLDETTDVLFAETRTAGAGGWGAFRKCGFTPLGFEPYAHTTPAGSEPMLFLGRLSERVRRAHRNPAAGTDRVSRLAAAVDAAARLESGRRAVEGTEESLARRVRGALVLADSRARARRLERAWSGASPHRSGVVGLERYEGVDRRSDRFSTRWLVAERGGRAVGWARVAFDRIDQRARILRVDRRSAGLESEIVARVVAALASEAKARPLTAVVDVRVDNRRLQTTLEALGFSPTVYYPRLLATEAGRLDAVQYTRTWGRELAVPREWADALPWSGASRVVETVRELAATRRASSRESRLFEDEAAVLGRASA